jgi:4-amino-4-deoxy-L-arabinose transferase-like glycosyltransferase
MVSDWFRRQPALAYPLAAFVLAALALLPLIGHYGLWDPHEFAVADLAQKTAASGDYGAVYAVRPPLTVWASAIGVDLLGPSELAARLPHALFALIGAMAAYGLGSRLRSRRAGLIAAIALVSSPLYLFEARQLTTDAGGLAGAALLMYGAVGLAWPRPGRDALVPTLLDAGALLVGGLLSFFAYGLVLAVLVPGLALALAGSAG